MKKVILASAVSALFGVNCIKTSNAETFNNSVCDTKLYTQLVKLEKNGIKRPKINPSKALTEFIEDKEVFCPLQIEKDFNGDKITDWVGVIEQRGKFYLVSYMSGAALHKLSKIKEYKRLPNNIYFDVATEERLLEMGAPSQFYGKIKFAAVENYLQGLSTAYSWDGKSMQKLTEFKVVIKPRED